MRNRVSFKYVASVTLLFFLAACSSGPDSRYSHRHDSAPARPITADQIPDIVPRADPITAAGNKSPYEVRGKTYHVLPDHRGYNARGIASWYGRKFNGHATSNGEIFDYYKLSAAHKSLPIPCYVRVTNLDNDLSVVVRVNDRGPFHDDRLIDLSYAAAVRLGFAEKGTARVEVQALDVAGAEDRRKVDESVYRYLQVGAFGAQYSAQSMRDELAGQLNAPVFLSPVHSGDGTLYRVRVGPVESDKQLRVIQQLLRERGYGQGQLLP
ncbi:MAG: septal ring lytic transglycosylase RlpA family protein [Halioglobus sp.]